uniref:NADH-ubiquinone oxidoreductase chain 3 n=1 Tax=Dermestes lardarius TaxID=219542 RepID=A0A7S6UAW6_DERLA|nr:NADH dehydrogenase subunit 3 [Dermestes lardarius]QOW08037.1 NADH dehydrogenase subunit 3 [Dermestes lardarius]
MIWMTSLIILIITSIMMTICSMISKKTFMDREKMSPFECGFDPKTNSRLPFSLQFFLIAVIFLIFDVEITLLIPLIIIMKTIKPLMFSIITIFFILVLIIGLFHEWNQGALEWTY